MFMENKNPINCELVIKRLKMSYSGILVGEERRKRKKM
jgi:hypothetical protein